MIRPLATCGSASPWRCRSPTATPLARSMCWSTSTAPARSQRRYAPAEASAPPDPPATRCCSGVCPAPPLSPRPSRPAMAWRRDAARSLDVLVDLDRTGAVTAPVCASGSKCTAGSTCDAVLQRCLPGPAFVTTTQPAGNGLASEALWSWTDAVVPHLAAWGISPSLPVGDDVIERLQCHDGPASINDAVLGKAIMTLTGDVRCAQASEPFPYGLRLLNGVDRNGGSSSSEDVGTLLGQCLADLAAVPPATPPAQFSPPVTSCISLMRVLPALGIAVGRPDFQTAGSRAARLVQHLIRGWITVSAFAAQQGLEAVDLGESDPSAPQTDLLALLDQLDGVWSVVTDGSVANALTSLPPRWLAEPDYRGSNRPRAYWAGHGSTDVASGRTLTPPSDAGWPGADLATIDPDELDLAGDLTVAMELDMDLADAFRGVGSVGAADRPARAARPAGRRLERGHRRQRRERADQLAAPLAGRARLPGQQPAEGLLGRTRQHRRGRWTDAEPSVRCRVAGCRPRHHRSRRARSGGRPDRRDGAGHGPGRRVPRAPAAGPEPLVRGHHRAGQADPLRARLPAQRDRDPGVEREHLVQLQPGLRR